MNQRKYEECLCSFCGKSKDHVRQMFRGERGANICVECVEFCSDLIEGPGSPAPPVPEEEPVPSGSPLLEGVTIATTRLEEMAMFYRKVLDADLIARGWADQVVFHGQMGGHSLQIVAAQTPGAEPGHSPYQFQYVVPDLPKAMEAAVRAGGSVDGDMFEHEGRQQVVVRDPDGNPIGLTQN